jgi:DNA polymerase III alpha subunit
MLWQWNLLQAGGRGKAFPQGLKPFSSNGFVSELKLRHPEEEEGANHHVGPNEMNSERASQTQERVGQARPLQIGNVSAAGVLFAEMEAEDTIGAALREIDAPDYTREQKLRYEREVLEVCVSGHPLDFLPRNGETWSDELPGMVGKRVTLCGWVVTYRHVGTKNYRNMMFVTLEDQRGLFEVILFPDVYDKYGGLVYETRSMRVTGVVMEGEHINGERVEKGNQILFLDD